VITSLEKKRDGLLQQFLMSNHRNDDIDTSGEDLTSNSVYAYMERRLFPEKQPLNAEELQRLLEADILAKINATNCEHTYDKQYIIRY
jgi:hypothetical protein